MQPQTVHFSSHPYPFRVRPSQCANPECECADVTFHFTPVPGGARDGEATAAPTPFEIRIDPETWQEIGSPQRPADVAEAVREFLRDYPPAERSELAQKARDKKEMVRRLREYRLDPRDIENSALVSFGQIANKEGSLASGGTGYSYRLQHDGHDYLVDDTYCPNPDCDCHEVHLQFFEYKPKAGQEGKDLIRQCFQAVLSLDRKNLHIQDRVHGTREEAEKAAAAWQAKYGAAALPLLKWRYAKVKEIARRSLRAAGVRPTRSGFLGNTPLPRLVIPPATRAGRNDPCPCGSGKKFKRCCGR